MDVAPAAARARDLPGRRWRSLTAPARAVMGMAPALALAAAGVLPAGCSPSLATLQPAKIAPKGHVQVAAGIEGAIPAGTIARIVDTSRALADDARSRSLAQSEMVTLFNVGAVLAASPPSVGQHFAIACTVIDRVEVGIRYAGGGWRIGGRYQVFERVHDGVDLVAGLGVARASTSIPFSDIIPLLDTRGFTRWTIDLPVLVGTSRSWLRAWTGPKFLYSRFDTSLALTLPMNAPQTGSLQGHAYYFGAQGGVAIGYRYLFIGVELTVAQLAGSATLATTLSAPTPPVDLSGFVVYPAFALMGEF